jgi:hypothetical protein
VKKWSDEERVKVSSRLLKNEALQFLSKLPKDLRKNFKWTKDRFGEHFERKESAFITKLFSMLFSMRMRH